tara:strand:+ start:3683 stop:5347 length:1665 start_codon:yes stop_codon:yes gene_type:complete
LSDTQLLEIKKDFRKFLYVIWEHLSLPEPTPVQYDIARYLQVAPKRRMIQAFRGVGKSWVTSAYCCWLLLNNADEKILVVSASKTRSDDFSIFTKRLINDVSFLQYLAANDGQRDSNIAFDVAPAKPAHAPSVKSVGITGQLTGSRATRIIADDIESLNNSVTQTSRDNLLNIIKEFDSIISPGGEITYLGTPQSEMSIYKSLPERGYEIRIWTARFPQNTVRYEGQLAEYITKALASNPSLGTDCSGRGKPTDPLRFTDLDLVERGASYGKAGFALQFMLDTSLSDVDKFPLKVSDLVVLDLHDEVAPVKVSWASGKDQLLPLESVGLAGDHYYKPMWISPEWVPYTGCVMFIDPSGKGKDETGYAIVKQLNGMLYVVSVGGFRDGYSDTTLNALSQLAKKHKVNYIDIEDNFGDGMFKTLLTSVITGIHPVEINPESNKTNTQKEKRIIDSLEPVLAQHRLVVSTSVINEDLKVEDPRYSLFYQLSRITRDKGSLVHDDRLDALAGAVTYWKDTMERNQETTHADHLEELRQIDLDKFMELAGGTLKSDSWV